MIRINVGGKIFTVSEDTLTKCIPNYFSAYLEWKPYTNYIFIDRDPEYFNLIINHMRGYTITIPDNDDDVVRLYEDACFYGIRSLVTTLEEFIGVRLTEKQRVDFKNHILSFSKDYNLDMLNHLSDKELTNIKTNIDEKIKYNETNKFISKMYSGLIKLAEYLEVRYGFSGIGNLIMVRKIDIYNLLHNIYKTDSKTTLMLFVMSGYKQ